MEVINGFFMTSFSVTMGANTRLEAIKEWVDTAW